jgi:hypothetical protein
MVGRAVRPSRMAVSRVVALRSPGRLALAPLAIPFMAWLSRPRAALLGALPLRPRRNQNHAPATVAHRDHRSPRIGRADVIAERLEVTNRSTCFGMGLWRNV